MTTDDKPRRTTVSELAKLLAERRTAATPRVMLKMVKPGEMQFELEVTDTLTREALLSMTQDALDAAALILSESNGVAPGDAA